MITYLQIMLAARFNRDEERGASAVEYGLLIAGIAALIVTVVFVLGDNILLAFSETCSEVGSEVSGGTSAGCS